MPDKNRAVADDSARIVRVIEAAVAAMCWEAFESVSRGKPNEEAITVLRVLGELGLGLDRDLLYALARAAAVKHKNEMLPVPGNAIFVGWGWVIHAAMRWAAVKDKLALALIIALAVATLLVWLR